LKKFQWDFARYQHQGKQLSELVGQIQSMASKIDDELKLIASTYSEKNGALVAAQRKKVINLATSDFEDFLKPEDVARIDPLDTEHLLTITIVVPKSLEEGSIYFIPSIIFLMCFLWIIEFLKEYYKVGKEIAAFGGPDWSNGGVGNNDGKFGPSVRRTSKKGSPVVPGSKRRIVEEGDSVMYAVTILKGHYEAGCFVDDAFQPGLLLKK
jgi:V-type H+-transporting ATPase subunit C